MTSRRNSCRRKWLVGEMSNRRNGCRRNGSRRNGSRRNGCRRNDCRRNGVILWWNMQQYGDLSCAGIFIESCPKVTSLVACGTFAYNGRKRNNRPAISRLKLRGAAWMFWSAHAQISQKHAICSMRQMNLLWPGLYMISVDKLLIFDKLRYKCVCTHLELLTKFPKIHLISSIVWLILQLYLFQIFRFVFRFCLIFSLMIDG
jgi:hypothetical protein